MELSSYAILTNYMRGKKMICAFLSDEAFANIGTGSIIPYDVATVYNYAMLDDNILNYFVKHEIITDPVGTGFATNRARRLFEYSTGQIQCHGQGRITLHFDSSKVDPTTPFLHGLTVYDTDDENSRRIKIQRRAALFNIIEHIYLGRSTDIADSNPVSKQVLDQQLQEDTIYEGYVAGSLQTSATVTSAQYRYTYRSQGSDVVAETSVLDFYDWFSFDYMYTENGVDYTTTIKIWGGMNSFKANYPYSTITDVIYPCSAKWLFDPVDSGGQVQAVIQAAVYKDAALDEAVTLRDHSGISNYSSRYVHYSVSSDARVSFITMYKGAAPDSAMMREAIREKLLQERDERGNLIGTADEWKERLPDLFIDGSFYIFPCYFQQAEYPNRVVIERSPVMFRKMYSKTSYMLPNYDYLMLFNKMEILQPPGHDLYLIAVPYTDNLPTVGSIGVNHPTYQSLDSVSVGYVFTRTTHKYYVRNIAYFYRQGHAPIYEYTQLEVDEDMIGKPIPTSLELFERKAISANYWDTMTPKTKVFAQLLANCLAACLDPTSMWVHKFTEEYINGRQYYSFVADYVEYHVLSLRGAQGVFDIEDGAEPADLIPTNG